MEKGAAVARPEAEMREGLEELQKKSREMAIKVREGENQTKDGIGYLEVKHLLLSSYCQHLVFLILLRAEGKCDLSEHPVIQRLAEIRLFLEKIRPIDKKLQYQIDKLLKQATAPASDQYLAAEKDDLKYRPNPDLLVSKIEEDMEGNGGVYKPPKIAPTAMDEKESAKDKRTRQRAEREEQRRASRSSYIKSMVDDLEGRPEEIQHSLGAESKQFQREMARLDARAKQEEDMFTRVPLSKVERKRLTRLKRSRNGLQGLMDDFTDDVAGLAFTEDDGDQPSRSKKLKKSKASGKLRVKKLKGKFKNKKKNRS
ncbi:neuroguidin [Selaginella moellendorffii]|uniref:neuroguidin n=1 Tax=Selaginella moellendorffii TaxID=88036 RepID=UPI000D1C7A45|nr:neuroguidin [Selaginella moellendorffii]XP_024536130.1 neuroguidin [Selaginella moellendorffii]XP_024536131.1 neuroguidin [Selaginella moellendorffii]|eukprot:XP_002975382.2 neuroguidin [Selaginella moellendorffii]